MQIRHTSSLFNRPDRTVATKHTSFPVLLAMTFAHLDERENGMEVLCVSAFCTILFDLTLGGGILNLIISVLFWGFFLSKFLIFPSFFVFLSHKRTLDLRTIRV